MTRSVCFTGVFLVFCTFLGAQSPLRMQRFARALDSLQQKRDTRLAAFRSLSGARQRTPDGFLLVDVTPGGVPVYKAPLNMYAAITTGVTPLQLGDLGLSLQGKGMIVGVWDDGQVADHIELGDRVIYREPAEIRAHSTHITGTLIASGINPIARGMAPLAEARTWWYDNDYDDIFQQQGPDAVRISNHSYGSPVGWVRVSRSPDVWNWYGDAAISNKEDYRFGLYGDDAWAIDELSNLDPYHTFVWAAGNDRWEVSAGHPKDGNEGTGYDCLIPEANAKNHIVVGAVYRVTDYTGPASVFMSTFGSWGPTDDGRIKPDLVADGVAVTSLNSTAPNAYASTQGTSQATANVTGSLILVQELYNRLHGNVPMRAATLRALAIHTVKEAGTSDGPDYQYGWGLLDVKRAAQTLLANDDVNVLVRELTLANQQTINIPLQPQAGEKITVTIGWTDPASTPLPHTLDPTTLMLINDLDVKLVDEDGNETLPWILDPANPAIAATRGNNFRDNVEKIEFTTPLDKKYNIVITHKGTLTQTQPFSLIVTHQSKLPTGTAYYWIGNTGNWSDAAHWSLTSGGATAGVTPTAGDRTIIDDKSFASDAEEIITLDGDATCRSLAWLTSERAALNMGAHTLTATTMLTLASDTFRITTPGTFKLAGTGQVQLHSNLDGAQLLFSSGAWSLGGTVNTTRMDIDGGTVDIAQATILTPELHLNNNATLDVRGKTLSMLTTFSKSGDATLLAEGATLLVNTPAVFEWNGGSYDGVLIVDNAGALALHGNNAIDSVQVSGKLVLAGSNTLQYLEAAAGAELQLGSSQTQHPDIIQFNGTADNAVVLQSTSTSRATIEFSRHEKICYDYLDISGVDVTGQAVVTAGANSTLANTSGWEELACDDVVFPKPITGTEPGAALVYQYAPNPADRELVITTSLRRCAVSIYNAMGQYIGSASSDSPTLHVDTSQMHEGMYIADLNGRKIKFVVLHH